MSKKIDPRDYVVTPDTEVGPIDLSREEFILRNGQRLTDNLAEQLANDARAEIRQRNLIPGRKSLSGATGQHCPIHRDTLVAGSHSMALHLTVSGLGCPAFGVTRASCVALRAIRACR